MFVTTIIFEAIYSWRHWRYGNGKLVTTIIFEAIYSPSRIMA